MSGLLTSPTFNVKNTPARTKKLKDFLEKHKLENSFNSATTYFDYVIENFVPKGITENTQENEEVNRLKTEVEKLKEENEDLRCLNEVWAQQRKDFEAEIDKLKGNAPAVPSAIRNPQSEIGFEILDDPRLTGFKAWRNPEHTHPFETLALMKQQADDAMIDFERTKAALMLEPLSMLRGPARDALMKWDKEVFVPTLRANTGIADLEISGEHKFLMMQDYCMADPVDAVLAILTKNGIIPADLKNLTAERRKMIGEIQDQQFPRAQAVQAVLEEMAQTEKIKQWGIEKFGAAAEKYSFEFLQDRYLAETDPNYKPLYEKKPLTDDTNQPVQLVEETNGEAKVIPITGNDTTS